jgi:NAD(P)-dependent dehydrogenase (short-subunit alcohol dehydrogenase family)
MSKVAAMELGPLAFLASDESSYCSGSEFTVDGALTAGPYLKLG